MLDRLLKLYERHVQALETFNALKGSELLAYNERTKIEQERHVNDKQWWRTWVDGRPPAQRHEVHLRANHSDEMTLALSELRLALDSITVKTPAEEK